MINSELKNEQFSYTGTKSLEILQEAKNYNQSLEDELVQFVKPEKQVIDFGAGIGEFAGRLRKHGVDVACIELDAELREYLHKNKFTAYSSIEEVQKLSRIYSLNVLEHIEDDIKVLKEIQLKLDSGGKLFLYVPAFMCLYTDFDKHVGHYRRYRRGELIGKLQSVGFDIERAEYVDSIGFFCWLIMGKIPSDKTTINPTMVKIFDRFLFPISRLTDRLFYKLFGKNLLVIASKS